MNSNWTDYPDASDWYLLNIAPRLSLLSCMFSVLASLDINVIVLHLLVSSDAPGKGACWESLNHARLCKWHAFWMNWRHAWKHKKQSTNSTSFSFFLVSSSAAKTSPAGPWFNIKMLSYQYTKSHCEDKTVVRSTSLYWIRPLVLKSW